MLPVSWSFWCVIQLAVQYVTVHAALGAATAVNRAWRNSAAAAVQLLEEATFAVTCCPMLAVLFLGFRMRAVQLAGDTDPHELATERAAPFMVLCVLAVLGQLLVVLAIPCTVGSLKAPLADSGELVMSHSRANPAGGGFEVATCFFVACLCWGALGVCRVLASLPPLGEAWFDDGAPASAALACTVALAVVFLAVHLGLAASWAVGELRPGPLSDKSSGVFSVARSTVSPAPVVCAMFMATRIRALQLEQGYGLQLWLPWAFYVCTGSMILQTVVCILPPLLDKGCVVLQREPDASTAYTFSSPRVWIIMNGVRCLLLTLLYAGVCVIVFSVHAIADEEHPEPRVPPAILCTMNLSILFLQVHTAPFVLSTIGLFVGGWKEFTQKAVLVFRGCLAAVMYVPLLVTIFLGACQRALQLCIAKDSGAQRRSNPQTWAQDAMFCATWCMAMMVMAELASGFILSGVESSAGVVGGARRARLTLVVLGVLRHVFLLAVLAAACVVVYGVFVMTPETLTPLDDVKSTVLG